MRSTNSRAMSERARLLEAKAKMAGAPDSKIMPTPLVTKVQWQMSSPLAPKRWIDYRSSEWMVCVNFKLAQAMPTEVAYGR